MTKKKAEDKPCPECKELVKPLCVDCGECVDCCDCVVCDACGEVADTLCDNCSECPECCPGGGSGCEDEEEDDE